MKKTFVLSAAALALAACSNDSTAPVTSTPTDSITVNASAAFTYLTLGTPATVAAVSSPTTDPGWDMGFFATTVTLDGGAAGPGGVLGYCLRCNDAATNAQIQALTAANQLAAFDSVTSADVPMAAQFQSDLLAPVITDWYAGAGAGATVKANRSWITLEGSGANVVLGKFHVTGISGATATAMGQVTFQYAVEPAPGQPFGAVQTASVTVGASPVYYDLTTGQVTTPANWDIAFDGWNIRVNGGVSGTGTIKAVPDTVAAFGAIDVAYAMTAPPQAYRADEFSGVFGQHKWYRYNITGTDNQIWPTYNIYLVRRASAVYKVQLTGYYGATGASRQITVRYARLSS